MQLASLKVEGFKRFSKASELELSSKVVAMVGPNEAGKSSLLSALLNVVTDDKMPDDFRSRIGESSPEITAYFYLDDYDRDAISRIRGGADVRWWSYTKKFDGSGNFVLHPTPERDLTSRHSLGASLSEKLQEGLLPQHLADVSFPADSDLNHESFTSLAEVLSSDEEDLGDSDLELVRLVGGYLKAFRVRKSGDGDSVETDSSLDEACNTINELGERISNFEQPLDPHTVAGRLLCKRMPTVLEFGAKDRDLRSAYGLSEEVAKSPPAALANFCSLAGIDLAALWKAIEDNARGERIKIEEDANKTLEAEFSQAWLQSRVVPRISIEGQTLAIVISAEDGSTYTEINERSDGFRWFVSLFAFLKNKASNDQTILLVDEAEQHLHYDAQADLVRVFTEQLLVSKIIFTTHSAGCLPHDLGTGVRPVAPIKGTQTSKILKSLWTKEPAGFSSLALAMGATSLAFLPARFVLFAEGPSDAMMLPSLFRSAMKINRLAFQVCPGIAVTKPDSYSALLTEGGAVRFLLDGDQEGENYRTQLTEANVPADSIFSLSDFLCEDTVLEDLVCKELFCNAVNSLIRDFDSTSNVSITPDQLPNTNRPKFVSDYLTNNKTVQVDKVDVANRILDLSLRIDRPVDLVRSDIVDKVAQLGRKINDSFEVP